jgi:hypothetical protein
MTVTERRAEKVLAALKKQMAFFLEPIVFDDGETLEVFSPITTDQPVLRMDWEWPGQPTPAILWEGGPYDWTMYFPYGGPTEEGITLPDVSADMPKGVHVEPYAGWATCLYTD